MIERLLIPVTFATALGCGLMAGVFFAFSSFVMKALARIAPAQGIRAMQSMNVIVINPWFMSAFLGTAVGCFFLAVSSMLAWHRPGAGYILAGSLLYLIGTILVTMVCNVPRNDALGAVDPSSADAASFWTAYVAGWVAWNHVRTAAALAAAASFTIAFCEVRAG